MNLCLSLKSLYLDFCIIQQRVHGQSNWIKFKYIDKMVGWFAIFVLCCVFLFTVILLYQYPATGTPIIVYMVVFIGWFTSFGVVTLLPYDVYISKGGDGDKTILHIAWVIVYWTAFSLCWLVLPVIEKYHISGEFGFFSRLRNALYRQLRSFLIIIFVGTALILYLYFTQKLTVDKIPELLVLMSNIWGLFLVIILIGYGLVSLPMTYWKLGSLETTLKTLQLKSVPLDEANIDSKYRLDQCVYSILRLSLRVPNDSPLRKFVDIIINTCPESSVDRQRALQNARRPEENSLSAVEYKNLVELHRELKSLISENQRTQW